MTQQRDWPRLSATIRDRREELGFTQQQLADAAQVGVSTVQLLESGQQRSRLPTSLAAVEEALLWEPGSAAAVLRGGTPTPRASTDGSDSPPGAAVEGMPLRVQRELRRGTLVDTQVIEGPGDSRFVVIWQSGSGSADAESLSDQDVASWVRVQRALRDLPQGNE